MSTGLAEEVLGNLVTVKSFAMEEAEVVKFEKSLDRASEAYSRLGVGIGVFAAASSLATNGKISFLSFIFLVIKSKTSDPSRMINLELLLFESYF